MNTLNSLSKECGAVQNCHVHLLVTGHLILVQNQETFQGREGIFRGVLDGKGHPSLGESPTIGQARVEGYFDAIERLRPLEAVLNERGPPGG